MNTKVSKRNDTVPTTNGSLVVKFASKYGVDSDKMLSTLKATAFKTKAGDPEVSNEQMMALLIVADQHGLNPFTKEIFAFPDKKAGIIPVVSVDGWARIINEHPQYDGVEFVESESIDDNGEHKPCPEWIETIIYRKDRTHPTRTKEFLDEVYRPPFKGKDGYVSVGPWQTHTKRFLRHKSFIQCSRIAFGFAGIYDEDEALRIQESSERVVHTVQGTTRAEQANDLLKKRQAATQPKETPTVVATEKVATQPEQEGGLELPGDAIAMLKAANNKKALTQVWDEIIEHYVDAGIEIPMAVEDAFNEQLDVLR